MKALLMAFSMYSRLPVPDFVWEEEDRKKAMCFFPLVGVLAGAVFFLVYLFMEWSGAGPVFKGALLTAVPLLATGGIHMDGFLDTCDARASWGDREKKLQILKDTHAGAFAVTGGGLYLLLYCGGCSELPVRVCRIRPVPGFKRAGGSGISRSQGARDAGGFHEGFQKTAGGGLHGILYGGFRRGHDPSGRPLRGGGGPWGRPGIFILQADGVPGVRRRHRGPGRVFFTAL